MSRPHPIPLAALESCVAIVGRSGSGKTTAARGAVEGLLDAGRQVVIIDPTGAWWGLRAAADGRGVGFPIPVLGGDHGDAPLPPDSGDQVAALIVEHGMSVVLDTSLMTMGERRRFYIAFLARLQQDNRVPLHLIVDEADELAPQKPGPDQTLVLHHMERIVRRGRVRGFRPFLITQRPAVLNKNVLSQAGLLIAMQLTASQDRAAIGGWIEGQGDRAEAKAMLDSLPKMARGAGWLWWPEKGGPERVAFPLARTFDSGAAPVAGTDVTAPTLGKVDMAWLREALAPKEEAVAGDTKAGGQAMARLRERVAELEAELVILRANGHRHAVDIGQTASALAALMSGEAPNPSPKSQQVLRSAPAPTPPAPAATPAPRQPAASGPAARGPELRILGVLAQRSPARFSEAQWASLSNMSRKGGAWATHLSKLRKAGWIEKVGGLFGVTESGLAAAGVRPGRPATVAERRADWARALGVGPAQVIEALRRAGSAGLDRETLAARLGMSAAGGAFAEKVSALRKNDLLATGRGGVICLIPDLLGD